MKYLLFLHMLPHRATAGTEHPPSCEGKSANNRAIGKAVKVAYPEPIQERA